MSIDREKALVQVRRALKMMLLWMEQNDKESGYGSEEAVLGVP